METIEGIDSLIEEANSKKKEIDTEIALLNKIKKKLEKKTE